MASIASDIGISAQAVYWHFDSKDDLLHAFLRSTLENTVDRLEEAARQGSRPTESLANIVRAHVTLELEEQSQAMVRVYGIGLLAVKLPSDTEEELRALSRKALQIYRDILREGIESGEFRQLDVNPTALAISTMCTGVVTWFRPERLGADSIAELHVDLALAAVRA